MRRILIADDQVGVRALLQELFRREQFAVETAVDGRQAVAKAAAFLPDIIVMDMQMPEMNGIEASEAIIAARPEQMIVLMTAHGEDVETRAASVGIRRCVCKPFDIMGFVQQIKQMLEDMK
jgi:CheY-like chemotaxis protein